MNVIDLAAAKFGSVNMLSKHVGYSQSTLAKMRTGDNPLSPEVAAACAEVAGLDPVRAAVEALRDQAKTPEQKQRWERRLLNWSGRQDSNLRPLAPEASALPS